MYLKRLEIQGFKSFAKKTTLEFEPGMTAIVGPNGSGKSNVADCLRWVLGEQSSKLLRGKKSEDVIFAGSDKKVRLAFAEVVATFDNGDHKIPVESAEVAIGRRIDRSGESQYLLNGNVVRLLDIVELVLKSNIGTSRYTVIGQGTIDQMILAGPSEVKGLIDEASGVKTYYIKRDKTLRRLEQTAQNLMRAEDLIAELEPRYKSLRRQAKRMEARAEVEQELKMLQSEWYGARFWQLKNTTLELDGKLAAHRSQRSTLENEIHHYREKLEHEEKSRDAHQSEYSKLQSELQHLQREKNQLLESLSLVRGKLKSQGASGDKESLALKARQLDSAILETKTSLELQTKQLAALQSEQTRVSEELSVVEKKFSELSESLNKPQEHINWEQVSRQIESLEQDFERFYKLLEAATTLEAAKEAARQLQGSLGNLQALAKQGLTAGPTQNMSALQEELATSLAKKEALQTSLHRLQLKASKIEAEESFLKRELSRLTQEQLHVDLDLKQASGHNRAELEAGLAIEEQRLAKEVDELSKSLSGLSEKLEHYHQAEEQERSARVGEEKVFRAKEDELGLLRDAQTKLEVEQAKFATESGILEQEMHEALGEELLTEVKRKPIVLITPGIAEKLTKLKHQLSLTGGVDELTMQEFAETETRYTTLTTQVADLQKGLTDLRQIIDELDEHIKTKFTEAFHKVNAKFEDYFKMLFNGGRAHLSLLKETAEEETEEAVSELEDKADKGELRSEEKLVAKYEAGALNVVGVEIRATPAGKKLSTIQALSGGERALTSIALLCSLLTCFPSPFVVLDEVDAALDEANTIRFGQILGTLSHQTQFLTITHNRETMAASNTLYGVTMGDDGISRLLSIKLEQAKAFAK